MSADGTGRTREEATNMPNGAAPHAPVPVTALERRYRRLLRSYPPSHRAAHREEMLGVLLDAARPGQRMPGVTQTVNLVACGLAIRARRALIGEPWRDALAVVSLSWKGRVSRA